MMLGTSSKTLVSHFAFGAALSIFSDAVQIDVDIHVEMLKYTRRVANTSPMKEMIGKSLSSTSANVI